VSLTRIHVCGGGLRALLVADVARRVALVSGRQARVSWAFDAPRPADLNIYPPDEITTEHPADGLLVNCPDAPDSLRVAEYAGAIPDDPLDPDLREALSPVDAPPVAGDADDADETLRRWRSAVAQWARSPGAPPSRAHVQAAVAAFGELDMPRAVEVLRVVEADNHIAPGAKFETFAYLDRILGVDLARDLGR